MSWWKARKKGDGEPLRPDTEPSGEATDDNKAREDKEMPEKAQVRPRSGDKEDHHRKNGQARLFRQLVASLKDKDAGVRSHAAWSLGRMGDARAVDALAALVNDKDVDVRKDVADALKRLGWKNKH